MQSADLSLSSLSWYQSSAPRFRGVHSRSLFICRWRQRAGELSQPNLQYGIFTKQFVSMDSPIDSPSSICNILFTVRSGYITMYTVQPLNWFVCSLFEGSLYLEDRARQSTCRGRLAALFPMKATHASYTTTVPLPGIRGSLAGSNLRFLYPIEAEMLTPGATNCGVCPSDARYAMVELG